MAGSLPPTSIGRFKVEALLGAGGMGEVYKAYDATLQRTIAIKTVRPDINNPAYLDRLYREAQAGARLQHPNIVTVYEAGEADGLVYIAMQFLKGESLAAALDRGELSFETKIKIVMQILEALQYAHSEGVIHRDIKPANVHRMPDGSIRILDFGLARIEHADGLTRTGAIMGTPFYASPEQLKSEPVDARTDIYSTGVMAYEMLTGRRAFDGENLSTVMLKVLSSPAPPMETAWTNTFPEIERIVSRAMAKAAADRYATAEDMRNALAAFLSSSRDGLASLQAEQTVIAQRAVIEAKGLIAKGEVGQAQELLQQTLRSNPEASAARSLLKDTTVGGAPLKSGPPSPPPTPDVSTPTGSPTVLQPRTREGAAADDQVTIMPARPAGASAAQQPTMPPRPAGATAAEQATLVQPRPVAAAPAPIPQVRPGPAPVPAAAADRATMVHAAGSAPSPLMPPPPPMAGVAPKAKVAPEVSSLLRRTTTWFIAAAAVIVAAVSVWMFQSPAAVPSGGQQVAQVNQPPAPAASTPVQPAQALDPPAATPSAPALATTDPVGGRSASALPAPAATPAKGAAASGTAASPTEPKPATPAATPSTPPAASVGAKKLFVDNASKNAGLRYAVVKQTAAGDVEVDPDTIFHSGDKVRFTIESNIDGYLYLMQEGSSGKGSMLFPSPQINGGTNAVRRGQKYSIPSQRWFEFDENAGTERVFVFLSKEPMSQLPGFKQPVTRVESVERPVVEQLKSTVKSRDLVFEKERPAESAGAGSKSQSTFVVNRDEFGQSVSATIQLVHQQ